MDDYLLLNPEKVFYTLHAEDPVLELYKTKPVILSSSPLDPHLFNFLESKLSLHFQRIDAAIDTSLVDPSREKNILDSEGRTEAAKIANFFRRSLSNENLEVEAKSLNSQTLPALVVLSESSRRFHEAMSLTDQPASSMLDLKKNFVVNTNNPLVLSLYHLSDTKPDLAKEMACYLYDLLSLPQKEGPTPSFINRTMQLLEKLISS